MIIKNLSNVRGFKRFRIDPKTHMIDDVIEALTAIREKYGNKLRVESTDFEAGGGIKVFNKEVWFLVADA